MEDLIKRLDKWLKQNRPDYYEELLSGLSSEQLDELEQKIGLTLPPEFRQLYS